MKTKIIPFDLETAKKIQAGEIEGRIVTVDGEPIRVLAFDINDSHPIAVAVTRPNSNEVVYTCKSTGKYIEGDSHPAYDIAIEIPEEAPKHEFKPFDKVLVRIKPEYIDNNAEAYYWCPAIFQNYSNTDAFKDMPYHASGRYWNECIPYTDNEYLVGTTYNPK